MEILVDFLKDVASSILTLAAEHRVYFAFAAILIVANCLVDTSWLPEWLHIYYNPTWIDHHRAWLLLIVGCVVISMHMSLYKRGLVVIWIIFFSLAIFFGIAYENAAFNFGPWPFLVWLSYRMALAFLVGAIAGFFERLSRQPSATPDA